ncbi:MADS-box protein defh21-like [Corylus avellana]|uniref:MADS-box protein defh21-like n=1 Tax=Corylus avellana TaxID=13451 RepID=UPI00286AC985|nr:MADS-box protein defh21-like [Corylus avellana]
MGRRKLPLSRIENPAARHTTFVKRRQGLFKKTHELSVLCDAQIALIIFSTSGKLFHYCSESEPSGMEHIIERYQNSTGTQNPENNDPQLEEAMHGELRMMQKEILNLQWSLKRFTGEDLSSIRFEDLDQLEQQLQCSVNMVRAKKFDLLQQQMGNLQMKEKMLQDENDQIYHLIKEKQAALMEHHRMGMVPNTEEHRHVLEQFPFSGEEQPSGVLQLATRLPSVFNPYHLLPAQPNLQDFMNLHHPNRP